MLIAQISDTHLAPDTQQTFGIASMAENLARCIQHINALSPKADVVFITGDISNSGQANELHRAASILNDLRCPYYVIPGNHDNRQLVKDTFGFKHCPVEASNSSGGFINFVVGGYALQLIALDSTKTRQPGGEICALRANWLAQQLAAEPEQATMIFMHHPPLNFSVLETDDDGFEGSDLLGDVVEKFPNIQRIACGHIHLNAHAAWRGTVVSTAPSIGMSLRLDLSMQLPSAFHLDPPSYQLHYWTAKQDLITHTVQLREDDSCYSFVN